MVELEDFKYGGTNITAFRLVDPNDELVQVVKTAITLKMLYSESNEFELKTLKMSKNPLNISIYIIS